MRLLSPVGSPHRVSPIIEAILVWQVVKRQFIAGPGDQAPSRRFVMGLVVLANLASAVVGAVLSTRT